MKDLKTCSTTTPESVFWGSNTHPLQVWNRLRACSFLSLNSLTHNWFQQWNPKKQKWRILKPLNHCPPAEICDRFMYTVLVLHTCYMLQLFPSITNSGEWRASILLCMHSVNTIFKRLCRIVTPKDELWLLLWWPTLVTKSCCSITDIDSSTLQGCILLWVTWLTAVNLDYTPSLWEALFYLHGLREQCLYSVFPDLHGWGHLSNAQHKSGLLQLHSNYFTLIFYFLFWTEVPWLNMTCFQIVPFMALWGFFKNV